MRIGIVIYNLLKNDSNVNAITTQIFPGVVPASVSAQAVPAITYNVKNTNHLQTKTVANDTNFANVQISVFHKSYNTVQNLADVITTALNGANGTITVSGTDYKYKNIRIEEREDVGFDEDNNVFMVALNFFVQMYN